MSTQRGIAPGFDRAIGTFAPATLGLGSRFVHFLTRLPLLIGSMGLLLAGATEGGNGYEARAGIQLAKSFISQVMLYRFMAYQIDKIITRCFDYGLGNINFGTKKLILQFGMKTLPTCKKCIYRMRTDHLINRYCLTRKV